MKMIRITVVTLLCAMTLIGCGNAQTEYQSPVATKPEVQKVYSKDKIFLYAFQGEISIYIKGDKDNSNKYVGYHIKHSMKELDIKEGSSNYDVWGLVGAGEFERIERNGNSTFLNTQNIVTSGEWDLALYENGASDFVGGYLHGDEITTEINLYANNQKVELSNVTKEEVDEVKLVTSSDLYRDNTITDGLQKIAVHRRSYTFNKDGLIVSQEVSFNQPLVLKKSYLAMLPILRKSGGATGSQITDSVKVNGKEFDVSTENFNIPEVTFVTANKADISGEASGFSASLEIDEKYPKDLPTTFMISNAPMYNKLYFSFINDGYEVKKDEVWKQTVEYSINTPN